MASSEVLGASEIDSAEAKSNINPEISLLEKKMNGNTLDLLEGRDVTLDASQDTIDIVRDTHANGTEPKSPIDGSNDVTVEVVNTGEPLEDLDEVLNGDGNESNVAKATPPSEADETIPLMNGSKDLDTVLSPKAFEDANLVDVTEENTGTESVTAPVAYQSSVPESEVAGGAGAQPLDTDSSVKVAATTEQCAEPIKENMVLASNDVGTVDAIPVAPDTVEDSETASAEGWEPLTEGIKPVEEAVAVEDETEKGTKDATEETDIEEVAKQPLEAHALESTTTLDTIATEDIATAENSEPIPVKEGEAVPAIFAPEFGLAETGSSAPEAAQQGLVQDAEETSTGGASDAATPAPESVVDPVPHVPDTVVSLSAEDTEGLDKASADVAGAASPAAIAGANEEISVAEDAGQSVAQENEAAEQNVIETAKDIDTKVEEEEAKEEIERSGIPEVQAIEAADISLDSEVKFTVPETTAVEDLQVAKDARGDAGNDTVSAIIPDVIDPIPAAPDITEEAVEPLTEGDKAKEPLVEDIKQKEVVTPVEEVESELAESTPVNAEIEETGIPEVQAVEAVAIEPESEVKSTVPEPTPIEDLQVAKDAQENVSDNTASAVVPDVVDPIPAAPDTVGQIVKPPVGAEESLNIKQEEVTVPVEETKTELTEPVPIVDTISPKAGDATLNKEDPMAQPVDAETTQVQNVVYAAADKEDVSPVEVESAQNGAEASVAHVNGTSVNVGKPLKEENLEESAADPVLDTNTETTIHVKESLKETAPESVVIETEVVEPLVVSQEAVKEDLLPSVPVSEDQPQTSDTSLDDTPIEGGRLVPVSETAEASISSDSQVPDGSTAETTAATEESAVDATTDEKIVPVGTEGVADTPVVDIPERKEKTEEKVPIEETVEVKDSIKDEVDTAGENVVTAGDDGEDEAEEAEEPVVVPRRARALTIVNVTVEQEVHIHDLDPHAPAHAQDNIDSAINEAEDVEKAEEGKEVEAENVDLDIKAETVAGVAQVEEQQEAVTEAKKASRVATDDAASSHLDIGRTTEIERPKSPWTPSYSVTSQGPGIAAEEEIPEIEQLSSTAQTEEVSSAGTEVPVVNVVIPETAEGEADTKVQEKEELQRPKSPWTPSYSVLQQGSPVPVMKELEETAEAAPEEKQELEPVEASVASEVISETSVADVVDAPVEEEEVATEAEVNEQAKTDVPTVVVPVSEQEDKNYEVTESAEGPARPKSPWTPSYSVSRQGSPALPVSDLPTAPVSDFIAAINGTVADAKAREDELPEVEVSQPDEAAIDETVAEAGVDAERPATPEVRVSEPEEAAVLPTSEVEQASESVTQIEEEHPKSPWTQSYSVSRQGSPQPPVPELPVETSDVQPPTEGKEQTVEEGQADTDPQVKEAIVAQVEPVQSEEQAEEAESANISDVSTIQVGEQTKTAPPALKIPEVPTVPEAESKSPWTPSYSVTTQGPDTESEEVEAATKGAQETIKLVAATQEEPAATSSNSLTVDTNATATPDRPRSPWTPSYSVMRQGSGVVDESNDETELDQLEKLPEPVDKHGDKSSMQEANATETVTVQPPAEGDKPEEEKNTEAFPSGQDDQRSLTSLDTVTKDDQPLPSPTGRSRLESTASSLIFPGGWFSKAPLGRTSLDNAKGEFASKPTSPVETMPEVEESVTTPTKSQPKETGTEAAAGEAEEATSPTSTTSSEKRSKWCTIM
ncbi:hypothetical protein WG66_005846 [Moniliophthora roreri]|uniref:Uncharacterized protein n=1 Tax=Moniliophthora roreri TaxID=221103 RepID=A0A0W0FRR3_MONRR|nr:hypothetical protein WG66_005846 [Moniliophthora roreri]